MPNRSGTAYGLTVLSPIDDDRSVPPSRIDQIRQFLDGLETGAGSPFARLTEHHFVRFAVLDDVFFEGYPAKVDHLQSAYLMFTSDFNGDLDAYLRRLVLEVPEVIEGIWGHCYGFPGTADPAKFIEYIKRCQLTTTLYFADNPSTTVEQVLRALDVQRRMIGFIEATQGLPAAPLQDAFRRFIAEVRSSPTPRPGSI
jgi:hypothetical protein